MSNEQILQRVTSDFTTSNEQRATSEKLQPQKHYGAFFYAT